MTGHDDTQSDEQRETLTYEPIKPTHRPAWYVFLVGLTTGVLYGTALVGSAGLANQATMDWISPSLDACFLILCFGIPVLAIVSFLLRRRPGWKPFMAGILTAVFIAPLWLAGLCALGICDFFGGG